MKQKFFIRILKRVIYSLLLFLGVYTLIAFIWVEEVNSEKIYPDVKDIPYNKVALLLGTNPYKWGKPNPLFLHRVNTAAQLFHADKVDYIIASGYFDGQWYDEPRAMRDSLIARGVPENRIILDFGGIRTYDSVVRTKSVFGCDSFTIISQPAHCARALYIANANGIKSVAAAASEEAPIRIKMLVTMREILSRDRVLIDILLGVKPAYTSLVTIKERNKEMTE